MTRQAPPRTPYRCRPCSERTGQVVFRAGHKCPVQAAIPMDEALTFISNEDLGILGSTEPSSLNPAIDSGVIFGMFFPFFHCHDI